VHTYEQTKKRISVLGSQSYNTDIYVMPTSHSPNLSVSGWDHDQTFEIMLIQAEGQLFKHGYPIDRSAGLGHVLCQEIQATA